MFVFSSFFLQGLNIAPRLRAYTTTSNLHTRLGWKEGVLIYLKFHTTQGLVLRFRFKFSSLSKGVAYLFV